MEWKNEWGWGCSSVVECLMHKALHQEKEKQKRMSEWKE
jgi:hypothetical protein